MGRSLASSPALSANSFEAHFDALWEFDFFGKKREQKKAAWAGFEAAKWQKEAFWSTLRCEIARQYIAWCGHEIEIEWLQQSVVIYEDLEKRLEERASLLSPLEILEAKAKIAQRQASLPPLQALSQQALYRLAILLGQPPTRLRKDLLAPLSIPQTRELPGVGLSSQLLRRRPDILAAEADLARATGLAKAAALEIFPSFTLFGAVGQQSLFLRDLSKFSSHYWSFTPGLTLPLFDSGRIKAQLKICQSQQEESLYRYEKTILLALEEVEASGNRIEKGQIERAKLEELVQIEERLVAITQAHYERGLVDCIDLLYARIALVESRKKLSASQVQLAQALLSLCKALNGTWEETLPEPSGS